MDVGLEIHVEIEATDPWDLVRDSIRIGRDGNGHLVRIGLIPADFQQSDVRLNLGEDNVRSGRVRNGGVP